VQVQDLSESESERFKCKLKYTPQISIEYIFSNTITMNDLILISRKSAIFSYIPTLFDSSFQTQHSTLNIQH